MITKPVLPPKAGYVETVNSDGVHVYKPTLETAARLEQEQDKDEMLVDLLYRVTLIELGVNE